MSDDLHSKMVDDENARGDDEGERRGKADVERGSSMLEQTDLETEEQAYQTREEEDLDHTLTVVEEDERQGAGEGEAAGGGEEPSAEEDDRTEGEAPFCNGVSRRKTNRNTHIRTQAVAYTLSSITLAGSGALTHQIFVSLHIQCTKRRGEIQT
jgi:hypothetical protein